MVTPAFSHSAKTSWQGFPANPFSDDLVENLPAFSLNPLLVVAEPRLAFELRVANQIHHPLKGGLSARRQGDPFSIPGLEAIAGGREHPFVSHRLGHLARELVMEHFRTQKTQERLIQRNVYFLTLPRAPPGILEGRQDPDRQMQSGDEVSQGKRRIGRGASRLGIQISKPAHAFRQGAKTRFEGVRARSARSLKCAR